MHFIYFTPSDTEANQKRTVYELSVRDNRIENSSSHGEGCVPTGRSLTSEQPPKPIRPD